MTSILNVALLHSWTGSIFVWHKNLMSLNFIIHKSKTVRQRNSFNLTGSRYYNKYLLYFVTRLTQILKLFWRHLGKYILVFEIAIDFSFYIIVWVIAFCDYFGISQGLDLAKSASLKILATTDRIIGILAYIVRYPTSLNTFRAENEDISRSFGTGLLIITIIFKRS